MDPNAKTEQKHEVVNVPGQRGEIATERTERMLENEGLSTGTIAIIGVLLVAVIGVNCYLEADGNASESANRNANVTVASQGNAPQPPVTIQQPAPAQQAPVIIQQPAPVQQVPMVVQLPAQPSQKQNTSAQDDTNIGDASKAQPQARTKRKKMKSGFLSGTKTPFARLQASQPAR